jgi:Zn-dependent alcohol dehydrogenase
MPLIRAGLDCTANKGKMVFLGVPPLDANLSLNVVQFMTTGKSLLGSMEGDAVPKEVYYPSHNRTSDILINIFLKHIPRMINWFKSGQFPIDQLVTIYKV